MNVLRFTGKDNRSALEQIRAQLGPDALILSSKRTSAGVEICAAASLPDVSQAKPAESVQQQVSPVQQAPSQPTNEIQLAYLKRELASLRETLQAALGERRWQDSAGQRPVAATIGQRLGTLGIGRVMVGELTDDIPANADLDSAWQHTMTAINRRLVALSDAEMAGFRVKLVVGASGVGKTRAGIAMLSEALRRHGADHVAVISCGDPRISSALAQTATALNLKVFSATDKASLGAALGECRWAREVIVDTPGLNPARGSQDPTLCLLQGQRAGCAAFLVLPATGHADHLRSVAEHAEGLPLAGAVISKVDEAVSLGGIIDVVAGLDLPMAGRMDPNTNTLVPVSGRELLTNAKRLAKRAMQRRAAHMKVAV